MQSEHNDEQRATASAPEETKGGLQHYVLEVDAADEQKTSELVFIDNPVRNGPLRIVWLGVCFFLLFVSYNVAQGAVTTLFPSHGFYSLALIYSGLMVGSVIAPVLIPRYLSSPRIVLFGVATMHCIFVASINLGETALLICSAGVGFSASLLWLQQGLYVTGVSQRAGGKIGKLTSIFFGIFNINMIVGNLISLVIESVGSAPTTVIWAMTVIAGTASLAFLAVPNLPPAKVSGLNAPNSLPRTDQPVNRSRSTISSGPRVSLFAVCRAAPMRNLAPIIIFSGTFITFIFGTLPIIADPSAKSISIYIALAFVSYGVAAALGAFVWGRLFDWRGPRAILLAQLAIGLVTFALFMAVLIYGPKASMFPVVMVASALCGALETATTTLINTCISVYVRPLMNYKDSAIAAAFSLYRILYCCGFVFLSLVTAAVPREQVVAVWAVPLSINLFFLLVGIASGLRMCANLPARLAASRSSSPTRPRAFAVVGSTPMYHEAMGDAGEQDTDYSRAGEGDEEDVLGSQASVGELDMTQMDVTNATPISPAGKSGSTRVASKASKVAGKLEARVTEMAKQTVRFVKGDFQKLDGREGSVTGTGPSSSGAATPGDGEEFDLGQRGGGN